jgi:predicted DNA-binding transcriptional regulator AlpA
MQVICLEEEAFYELVEEVVRRVLKKNIDNKQHGEKWISDKQAMGLLGIKSKTTLQKLRDSGQIRFSQPEKRIIRYDRNSIEQYLEKHAR